MAIFTINHSGLPTLQAITDTLPIPVEYTVLDDVPLNVLQNDLLGYQPTIIIDVTPTDFSIGTLEISEDGFYLILKAPWDDSLLGTHTFEYTIKDSYDRESTIESAVQIF